MSRDCQSAYVTDFPRLLFDTLRDQGDDWGSSEFRQIPEKVKAWTMAFRGNTNLKFDDTIFKQSIQAAKTVLTPSGLMK